MLVRQFLSTQANSSETWHIWNSPWRIAAKIKSLQEERSIDYQWNLQQLYKVTSYVTSLQEKDPNKKWKGTNRKNSKEGSVVNRWLSVLMVCRLAAHLQ